LQLLRVAAIASLLVFSFAVAAARAPEAAALRVGTLLLHRCPQVRAYCGSIERPLDPANQVAGVIRIGFSWLPHRDAGVPAEGTILAAEGGPGYPSGASLDSYQQLFKPLLVRWNLLLVDDRGTGRSGALVCEPLQRLPVMTLAAVARCGRALGPRADLYGTAIASDDIAAVLDGLEVDRVTLYGDSYGTLMVQTFAGRHPNRVRAIVLDGAYPVAGSDPWLGSVSVQIRRAFDAVCERSPPCAALGGSSLSRIERLLAPLRRSATIVSPSELAFVMASAGLNPVAYQELDAAARAYSAGDRTPLLRLVHEAYRYEERDPADPAAFSAALFVASTCADDPEPYDMTLMPAQREAQWQHILRQQERNDPRMDAPFSIPEFLGMPPDYGYLNLCVAWPVASAAHPAREPLAPDPRLPDVPALVLVGDLDTITTPQESAAAAALFPRSTFVVVRNTGHVTAVGDVYDCASAIVRRFIATLHAGDTSCTQRIPAMRLVATFERRTSARFTADDAALAAARDVLARVRVYGADTGTGLRGGRFRAVSAGAITTIELDSVAWTRDTPVSGRIVFDARTGKVVLDANFGSHRSLHATWNEYHATMN
jgi:pimeloyl-ACP methyl ester carboxylesterase